MKSMKKSMFVTTILMVVLLIVALSTATFAWYTANTNVGAEKVAVTSAQSDSSSLVIDGGAMTSNPNAVGSSVALTMTGSTVPMVYTSDTAASTNTTYASFVSSFTTLTVDSAENIVADSAASATPLTISNVDGALIDNGSAIWLTNVGGGSISTVNARIDITAFYEPIAGVEQGVTNVTGKYTRSGSAGSYVYTQITAANTLAAADTTYYDVTGNNMLRVAVFAGTSYTDESTNDLKLVGVYGAGNAFRAPSTLISASGNVGTAIGSNKLNTDLTALKASGDPLAVKSNLASHTAFCVKVVAWFEGGLLYNADADKTATFTISFTAA